VEVVGISAGASTPDSIITSVTEKIRKIGNINKEEVLYD
jgi:4-hydroxy-3-methylbut-2-enyl diphosphate reductase IspH